MYCWMWSACVGVCQLLIYVPMLWNSLSHLQRWCKLSELHIYTTYEYGTDRVFRNVGTQTSDARESSKRKNTTVTILFTRFVSHAESRPHYVNHPDSRVNSQLMQNSYVANTPLIKSQNHILKARHYGFITDQYCLRDSLPNDITKPFTWMLSFCR